MTLLHSPQDLQYILRDDQEITSGYSHIGFIYVCVDKQFTKPEQRALHLANHSAVINRNSLNNLEWLHK